jgi:hypothetical protein
LQDLCAKVESEIHSEIVIVDLESFFKIKSYAVFEGEDYALLHHKTIQRQEKQNNFYSNIK